MVGDKKKIFDFKRPRLSENASSEINSFEKSDFKTSGIKEEL